MPIDIETFRRGAVLGFAVAAPVGPIGVLVIRRSMNGAALGLLTGLGAAAADAMYAVAGALATAWVARLLAHAWLLELAGGAALGWLALRTWRGGPQDRGEVDLAPAARVDAMRAFLGAPALTLANPATILSFAAVSAGLGVGGRPSTASAFALACGVLVGSGAWWLFLSGGVRLVARRVSPRALRGVRLASGAVLAAFAVAALAHAVASW